MTTLPVQLITPSEKIFVGQAAMVLLPSYDGQRGILPDHADFIGKLGTGVVSLINGGKDELFAISEGIYHVSGGELKIMAMAAMEAQDVELEDVKERLEMVEEKLETFNRIAEDSSELEKERDYYKAQIAIGTWTASA
ncbi:MAG: ATP synthase F1 subunit epsilon [Deltaproteobacteria bacterium]|nr:ATP synthase F1 subunit epsilon [Deltaproteobacteria bacterium]